MGTNYYWYEKKPCECCGREFEAKHIGKSSCGWCFSLYVGEWEGPKTLNEWKERFYRPDSIIQDEYGQIISPDEMLATISDRKRNDPLTWDRENFAMNHAERGPNNLIRHSISKDHCIGHGEGTWDYIVSDFS